MSSRASRSALSLIRKLIREADKYKTGDGRRAGDGKDALARSASVKTGEVTRGRRKFHLEQMKSDFLHHLLLQAERQTEACQHTHTHTQRYTLTTPSTCAPSSCPTATIQQHITQPCVCVCDCEGALEREKGKWVGREGHKLPLCAYPDLIADRMQDKHSKSSGNI